MPVPEPTLEPGRTTPEAGPTSFPGRLLNILAAPAEVFDQIKQAPVSVAHWLVPAILVIVVSWIGAAIIFSQPALQHQAAEISDRAIEKMIAKQHLTKDQAEQARQQAEKFAGLGTKIAPVLQPIASGFLLPVWWALLIWLAGNKALKAGFPFIKALEVTGLANMICVLGAIIKTLLILITGNLFASPSLALLIKDFNPQNPTHGAASVVNIMTFWFLAVVAIGLQRLSNASFLKSGLWVLGLWALYTGLLIGIGFGIQALMGGS